jgi:tetratricopeptide (TPR) repeat protein
MKDPGRHQKLVMAEMFEHAGQFDVAETLILEVLRELDSEKDQALIGELHINLGGVAAQAGRPGDSIRYFTRAVELLEPLKGDPILQCAHAHFNLATVLLDQRDARALQHSDRALELYTQFPFAEETDLVDARIAVFISLAGFSSSFDIEEARRLWRDMKNLPFGRLTKANVLMFVVMCTNPPPMKNTKEMVSPFAGILDECRNWASKDSTGSVKQHPKDDPL